MKTQRKFLNLKFLAIFVAGLFVASFAVFAATTTIDTNLSQAVQYIQKIVLTSDGGQTGTTGVVVDGVNNRIQSDSYCDLTGTTCKTISSLLTTETDPVFMAASGNYYLASNPSSYISSYTETDPVFMAASGNYYLASNPSGYISGYTETDPICSTFTTGEWNDAYNWIQTNSGNAIIWLQSGYEAAFTLSGNIYTNGILASGNVNATSFSANGSGGINYTASYTGVSGNMECLQFVGGILVNTGC